MDKACLVTRLAESLFAPGVFKAVWHYPDEDFVYFNGIISEVTYGYNE